MKEKLKIFVKKSPLLLLFAQKIISFYLQLGSKKKWKNLSNRKTIKIELGSGAKNGVNGWTTIDQAAADIRWDLRRGIPLPDNSVDMIYSSHLLEHITYNQLIPFLQECRRVMKSDGKFSVCVPNFRFYVDAYKEGKLFRERETWWEPGLINTGSVIDQLNYSAYMKDEHKYMFDEENLVNTLIKAEFSDVMLRNFDDEVDLHERDMESIYAIAGK